MKITRTLLIIWVMAINVASPGSGFQTAFLSYDRFSDPVISAAFMDPDRTSGDLAQPDTHRANILTIEQAFIISLDPTSSYFDRTHLAVIQHTQDPFSGFCIYKLSTTEISPCGEQFYES